MNKIILTTLLGLLACTGKTATAATEAQIQKGKQLFMLCQACHAYTENAGMRIGPNLAGMSGKEVGFDKNYSYSKPMAEADFLWTDENLDIWLKSPATMIPGTRMSFAGLQNPEQRAAIIAFLNTL